MSWNKALRLVAQHANAAAASPTGLSNLCDRINAEWIKMALATHQCAAVRKRKLPQSQVIWLVIGLALFRNRSIVDVVSKLDLVLTEDKEIARSSVMEARARLGAGPLETLFQLSADEWTSQSEQRYQWRGLKLLGIDGTKLNVPDTEENAKEFGKHGGARGEGAYPMVRLVCLMNLVSHLIRGVRMGGFEKVSEVALTKQLLSEIPDDSLTILDRNFLSAVILLNIQRKGLNRQWMTRAKANTKWTVVKELGPGDFIVELTPGSKTLKDDPTLPKKWQARAIQYQRKGFSPQFLLTSLTDPKTYPAAELVDLYHVRWELELGYDEIKTEMLEREETIRSKKPVTVQQEIWGILIAFNLVRKEMEEAALQARVLPMQLSFVSCMRIIVDEFGWLAVTSPGAIPKRLGDLRNTLAKFALPARRSERSYPRAVRVKMSGYPKKNVNP